MLGAALKLIEREGATALTLRAVARQVGVSSAAPYRHFASREALLAAVAEEGFRLLGEKLRRAIAAHDDPARRLGEAGVAYVRFAAEHPSRYEVMFSAELVDRAAYPSLQAAADDTSGLLFLAVRNYQDSRKISSREARELGLSAWASVHGLGSLITSGHIRAEGSDPHRVEEIARSVARWVVRGFDG